MGNIAIFRINYKSDFVLTLNSDAGWMTPFCIKFWTGAPSQAYFAGWDGTTYTNCTPVAGEPTKLLVQFDDHHLPVGELKFQIGYHFTIADFPNDTEDEVLNQERVIIEIDGHNEKVMLDFNGETAPDIQFSLPAYANEAQRIANEQERIANEQQRIDNEQERIDNEQTRQRNEGTRIENEQQRVQEFGQMKGELEQATRDAAAAAENANEKGVYAKNQGDYAKQQGDYAKQQGDIAQADHERAEEDHRIAGEDHTQAGSDHTRAGEDHTQAGSDHTRAGEDHTRAGDDHTRADQDHTRAESDHAAVELYVDSLGAFDISAYHATGGVLATYANLQAALGTNGANIPEALRKGGMSVKFVQGTVQSSDNNYIQYRCIADEFTTDVTKWQGVDAEPSAGNNNLCVSKGILQAIADSAIDELKLIAKITNNLASPNNPTRLNFYKGRTYIISISADNDITGTQLSLKLINPDDSTAIALAGNVLPLGTTKKKFFFSPTQDYIDVRIGSYVEIDSSLLNNRTLIYNISEFPEDINGAYFDGGATPTFDENGMTISMVLPAKMLTLFDERAGQDIQIDLTNVSAENRTYEIVNYNKVVYNRMTNAIQYVPLANKGNYITLLANNGKNITGLLSGYYYNRFKIGTLEAFVNGVQQFVNEETVNISDYPAQSKFTKGSSNGNFWCDRTFHLVKGRSYKITAIPSVDIHNSQSSSAISDGYFSIKIADSSKTTLKALNFASAYAGQPIVLSYIPTQDYNGCYIGSWNDRASESDIQFTIQEIRMHELYHEDIVKTVAVKQYSAFNAIFFSDIHKAENNLVRILEAARIISPDCILNGGDTVEYGYILGNGSQESLDWYNNKIYSAPCDIISALGNHDAWDWSEHAQTGNVKLIPQLTAYNAFTKKVVEKTSDIVQPTNAATDGLNYYYKDYGNVRLIVIDAVYGGNTGTQGPAIPAYITAQNTWFTSVLADAKTNNKTVVCVAHGIDPSYIGGTLTKFGQFNNFLTFGQNYTINGTTVHTHDGFSLNADTMNIVDDFISGGGKFACWLMGHAHFDQTFKLSGHPNQLVFVTSTARYNYHKADGNTDDVASKLYDCFNMFGIIPDLGIIKIMRFGYDTNNTLNNVNSMAYDYVNGNIIQF